MTISWQYFIFYLNLPADRLMSTLAKLIRMSFLVCFWSAIYGKFETNIVSYFLLVSFLDDLISPDLGPAHNIEDAIHNGTLNNYLIRPLNPALKILFEDYGRYLFYTVTTGIPSLALAVWLIKPSFLQILLFITFCIFGSIITDCLSIIVATFSFWGPVGEQIRLISRQVIMLISGYLVPLTFFSEKTQGVFSLLPFRHMIATPIELLQGKEINLTNHIIMPVLWVIVLIFITNKFWHIGLKKYEGIGA